MEPLSLELKDIEFDYGRENILRGVSLSLKTGEIVALIGLSGSGKTTLFRLVTGLISPTKGSISIYGQSDANRAAKVSFLQQEDLLLPWRTVKENILLFRELGRSQKQTGADELLIEPLLEKVGLYGVADLYPDELSVGMRHRVSLARALFQDRPLFLLDEPFGSLDVLIREELYELIKKIRAKKRSTIFLVTHDFRDAIALSNRIFVLSQGKIAGEFLFRNEEEKTPDKVFEITQSIRDVLSSKAN